LKREVHPSVSSSVIDDWYAAAKRAGAAGGKLLSGGGGFLPFFASPERHSEIEKAIGLRRVEIGLERSGSRVLLYHNPGSRNGRRQIEYPGTEK
jgi:D-glycero-alpha-D-manno-heptose-7-phosphate kinase